MTITKTFLSKTDILLGLLSLVSWVEVDGGLGLLIIWRSPPGTLSCSFSVLKPLRSSFKSTSCLSFPTK